LHLTDSYKTEVLNSYQADFDEKIIPINVEIMNLTDSNKEHKQLEEELIEKIKELKTAKEKSVQFETKNEKFESALNILTDKRSVILDSLLENFTPFKNKIDFKGSVNSKKD